jgi:hypothetical protein
MLFGLSVMGQHVAYLLTRNSQRAIFHGNLVHVRRKGRNIVPTATKVIHKCYKSHLPHQNIACSESKISRWNTSSQIRFHIRSIAYPSSILKFTFHYNLPNSQYLLCMSPLDPIYACSIVIFKPTATSRTNDKLKKTFIFFVLEPIGYVYTQYMRVIC